MIEFSFRSSSSTLEMAIASILGLFRMLITCTPMILGGSDTLPMECGYS